ncbi:Dihydropteroate synthase [Caloramator mitchellensis]|uniref:Dihydropteroate synthase n=1 Tax=Caloramator mitchellensis TaxID=908809 RepID=A0A0R3K654_CALMK|nr:dihydropteroate synthase [Caloramator mitchellensis]KRQ87887.1 Dihydropteroate synthase [Caloramator mitchellensis]
MSYIILRDGRKIEFQNTRIMGILNATPDSFFEGSRVNGVEVAQQKALKMIDEGADILDIGGESTRPGSEPVSEDEEIKRVIPVIEAIRKVNKEIIISVDTYRAKTAELAIQAGADIINDISAMMFDKEMINVIKKYNVPVILMHIKGTPKNMQNNPHYNDVVKEVYEFLEERIKFSIDNGIEKSKIITDPGIGFGKLFDHNIELIKNIEIFKNLGCPVLLAHSRKSSIGVALGNLPPEERLEGTIAISCYAALKGIEMVRVHDVKENKRAIRMIEVLR